MSKTYNDKDLMALLATVEADIATMVKSEKLAKAHPGEETSDETPPDDSASADKSASPAPDAPPEAPPAAPEMPPAAASPEMPPADGSAGGDPAADQSADPAALEAEYSKLPPEDLKAHYLACKSALFAIMSAGQPGDAPMAPDAAPPMPAAPMPPASAPPALKSEKFNKSEKDVKIEALTADLEKSGNEMTALLSVVKDLIERPIKKGIYSGDFIAKSEEVTDFSSMSRADIKAKLKSKATTGLSKSDCDLVYKFDVGNIGVDKIIHLLK